MNWYYTAGNKALGPVDTLMFQELVKAKAILPDMKVWHEGLPDWIEYGKLFPSPGDTSRAISPAASEYLPHQPMELCALCRTKFPTQEMIMFQGSWICASCKPAFVQTLKEGGVFGDVVGLYRRGRALVVKPDAIIPKFCLKCGTVCGLHEQTVRVTFGIKFWKKIPFKFFLCDTHAAGNSWKLRAVKTGHWILIPVYIAVLYFDLLQYRPGYITFLIILLPTLLELVLRPIHPRTLYNDFVWVNGVPKRILNGLPQWSDRAK